MKFRTLLLCLLSVVILSGCAVGDFLNRDVEVSDAKAKAAQVQAALDATSKQLAHIKDQLAAARAVAEQTQSAAAIKVVATLERAASITEATLPHLQDAVARANETVAQLEASGATSVPLWSGLVMLVLPFVPKLVALIPGIGAAAAPVALVLANAAHAAIATRQQREADELAYKRSAALSAQTDVAGEALASLERATALLVKGGALGGTSTAVLDAEGVKSAQAIKDAARKEQERAGLYDVIRPEVLRQEHDAPKPLLAVGTIATA